MGELRAFHNELLRLLSTFHVGCTPSSYPLALIGVPNPGSGLEGIRRKEAISPTHDAKSDCEARANGRSPDFESRYIRRWPCIISQTCQKKKKKGIQDELVRADRWKVLCGFLRRDSTMPMRFTSR